MPPKRGMTEDHALELGQLELDGFEVGAQCLILDAQVGDFVEGGLSCTEAARPSMDFLMSMASAAT